MSWYYSFYLMKKSDKTTETGTPVFDYAGAFSKQDASARGCAVPLEVRGHSFIHGETFDAWERITYQNLSESAKKALFSNDYSDDDMDFSTFRICPFTEDVFQATEELLTRGYVTISEFDTIVSTDYDTEYLEWEADVKKPEFVAALPAKSREKYVPVAFLNRYSDAYIYETIRQAADMLDVYPFGHEKEYYILCMIG